MKIRLFSALAIFAVFCIVGFNTYNNTSAKQTFCVELDIPSTIDLSQTSLYEVVWDQISPCGVDLKLQISTDISFPNDEGNVYDAPLMNNPQEVDLEANVQLDDKQFIHFRSVESGQENNDLSDVYSTQILK